MPSKLHEAIAEMLRAKPELLLALLRMVRSDDLPETATATRVGEALSPIVLPDYRPDAVIELRNGDDGTVERVVIVEAQLNRDEEKLWSLPAYQSLARARHRVECEVVIIAPNRSVAAWLRPSLALGGGSIFQATVIGPEELRAMELISTTPPEIGFLRAIASDVEDDALLVLEVLDRLSGLPDAHVTLYFDLIVSTLPDAVRRKVEELMSTRYEYQSDFAKKYYGQGREEGREEGREAGREEGRRETLCAAIRRVLEKRGMLLADEQIKQLDACTDIALLEAWHDRAVVARAPSEVFEMK